MRLILIRHGRTAANEARLYCGSSDLPLSEAGRAELCALRAAKIYPDIAGLARITSGMRRTDETLRLLFDAAPDLRLPGLREMNFGAFELHGYEELKERADYQAWIAPGAENLPAPGGESARDFRARVRAAAEALRGDALIVCHGGVIAALMDFWFPEENRGLYGWQPGFGLGYALKLEGSHKSYRVIEKATGIRP